MNDHSERKHARYSPSQAERFFACPGSAALLAKVPYREQSPHAIEGTKAHMILDAALSNMCRSATIAHNEYSVLFAETFEEHVCRSVQVALDFIFDLLDDHPDAVLYNEAKVNPPLPADPGEAAGYCDVAVYVPSLRKLYVIDFKHGAGVVKSARNNRQALQYGAGFLYGEDNIIDPATVDTVVLVIIQPRAFHVDGTVRTYEVTPYDLYVYLDELNEAVLACQHPKAPLIPGDHCNDTFCDARAVCPAREAMALSKVNDTFRTVSDIVASKIPDVQSLDVERLANIKQWVPYMKRFFEDVDEYVKELMEKGVNVPGYKLVETQARREWYGNIVEVAPKLASLIGCDTTDVMETKMIGITEAEARVVATYKEQAPRGQKKKAAEDAKVAMALLTIKQSSGNRTVVPLDDPRPPVNRADAFTAITGQVLPPSGFDDDIPF